MADRTVGSLPRAPDLYDDSLLLVEQQGAAASITGRQIKGFARAGVEDYVADAQNAATAAQEAVKNVGTAVEDARSARKGAEAAQKAVEDMEVSAYTLPTGSTASVEKTAKDGHVLLNFGLPTGARGLPGNPGSSIQKIERTGGSGAAGTVDTYTITLTDGSTATFQVYNGADGKGAGDMLASVYDPKGKRQDIFAYADALLPVRRTAALTAAGWAGTAAPYTQTVNVEGVRADEAGQLVQPVPAGGSLAVWTAAGVQCTGQGAGTLTFTAQEKPSVNISVFVILWEVRG